MSSLIETTVSIASTVIRVSAYGFLRWIPGHHFPPVIVLSLAIYLTTIAVFSSSFAGEQPLLRELFPKLFKHENKHQKKNSKPYDKSDHEPAIYHEERKILKILLLGIPNWREWELSYATIAVNVLLVLLSLDLIFRGPFLHPANDIRFSRVGHVDSTIAKVLVREPSSTELPLYVYLKTMSEQSWSVTDTIYWLGESTDYTYSITLTNLEPDTQYQYSLSNNLEGSFTTAPLPGTQKARSLVFLTSSCIKANYPYDPFSHSLAIHGFNYMSKIVQNLEQVPAFMLFLGDFIYVDVPLRFSSTLSHYRSEYRRIYASPSWGLPGLSLPWLHVLDDHEIANDWASGNSTDPFPAASDPFLHYHVSVNPPPPTSVLKIAPENVTFFEFTRGPASFFMLDTRRYRTAPEQTITTKPRRSAKPFSSTSSSTSQTGDPYPTMLGAVQLEALMEFLRSPPPPGVHFKFVISSVPFTKNWRFGTSDSWAGFLTERKKILDAMHDAEYRYGVRIVILSGDRHEFAAIRFPQSNLTTVDVNSDDTIQAGPHEFSVGPLSMFYLPFRTFKQIDNEDVTIAYLPDGNSKIGVIKIEPDIGGTGGTLETRAVLHYSLWTNGEPIFTYNLTSPAPTFRGKLV